MRLILALLALLLAPLLAGPAAAQTFPRFTGLVVDDAHVLSPATVADLTRKLEALQQQTNRQVVVATIADLQGFPIEDYGHRLGDAWGVGLRDANNGIILFLAPNNPEGQRGPRIEVGRGMEGIVPDILAGRIIDEQMIPRLRNGRDIDGAMTAGTDALIAQLRASPEEAQAQVNAAVRDFDRTHVRRGGKGGGVPLGLIFWGIVLGAVLLSGLFGGRRRRGRRFADSAASSVWVWGPIVGSMLQGGGGRDHDDWGSGGGGGWGGGGGGGSSGGWGGGGFTGGGGGSFGGGGASGSW